MIFNYIEEKPIPTDDKGGFEILKLHKGINLDQVMDYVMVTKQVEEEGEKKILKNLFIRLNQTQIVEVPKEFIVGKGRKETRYIKESTFVEHKIFDTETVDRFLIEIGAGTEASNVFEETKELETA
jgi:hypothetical protein